MGRRSSLFATLGLTLLACSSEHLEDFASVELDASAATGQGGADGGALGEWGNEAGTPGESHDDAGAHHGGSFDGGDGGDAGGSESGLDAAISDALDGSVAVDDGDGGTAGGDDAGSGTGALDGGLGGALDASLADAGTHSATDAAAGDAGPGTVVHDDGGVHCDFGSAENQASTGTLNLFGQVVYFADGFVFPPGTYRVVYEDGCMKYASSQAWTIHAYDNTGIDHRWWIVGENSADRKVRAPGTVGIFVGQGGHATFGECVAANQAQSAPVQFSHAGGRLGVWLHDSNYPDNVPGENDRNPKWRLERLDGCEAPPTPE